MTLADRRTDRLLGHLLDLAAWDALDEDTDDRFELVEGVLAVSPRPVPRHQELVLGLQNALRAGLGREWTALAEVELLVEGDPHPTVRVPDVVVARRQALRARRRMTADDVLAVVEVSSPGSRRTDRIAKAADYAEVGVAHYLLVEPGPPVVLGELALDGGSYGEPVRWTEPAVAALALGVTLDLATLADL